MIEIKQTEAFKKWLNKIQDSKARIKIIRRIERIKEKEYFGDVKFLGDHLYEMREFHKPGWRIYFTKHCAFNRRPERSSAR